MRTLANGLWKLQIWKDTRGQDFVEYALAGGLVAAVAVTIFPGLGSQLSAVFTAVLTQLNSAGGSVAKISPAG